MEIEFLENFGEFSTFELIILHISIDNSFVFVCKRVSRKHVS